MKNLIKDKNGNANIIILGIMTCIMGFGMLTIGSYIYYSVANVADAGDITLSGSPNTAATGNWAFNGTNITNYTSALRTNVTITNGSAVYIFEFYTLSYGTPACFTSNAICVPLININTSLGAATNLTAYINANASAAAIVTATRVANTTVLTSTPAGAGGNAIVLTDDSLPGDAARIVSTTMSGGHDDDTVTGQASQTALNDYVGIVFPLFGLALLVLGFSVILITLRGSFGKGEGR